MPEPPVLPEKAVRGHQAHFGSVSEAVSIHLGHLNGPIADRG
jgi:hypothetical protein